jgi:hypothetical protein
LKDGARKFLLLKGEKFLRALLPALSAKELGESRSHPWRAGARWRRRALDFWLWISYFLFGQILTIFDPAALDKLIVICYNRGRQSGIGFNS